MAPTGLHQVDPHRFLHMSKPIPAQMFAAIPTGHHDDLILNVEPLKHPQDDHTRTGLTIVVLQRPGIGSQRPAVMRRLGKFLFSFKRFDKRPRRVVGTAQAT